MGFSDPIIIVLSEAEVRLCVAAAVDRRMLARAAKRRDRYGEPDEVWDSDILGCLGEYVVCKYLGRVWDPQAGIVGAPDCGPGIQARCTRAPKKLLILHDDDADGDFFVLVIALDDFHYRLAGGIYAREGKLRVHWKDKTTKPAFKRPAYGVPQACLHKLPPVPRSLKPRRYKRNPFTDD